MKLTIFLVFLSINLLVYRCVEAKDTYYIGAILNEEYLVDDFRYAVQAINKEIPNDRFELKPITKDIPKNSLASIDTICNLVNDSKSSLIAIIISSLEIDEMSNDRNLLTTASLVCAFYSIPMIGINTRYKFPTSFIRTMSPYNDEVIIWSELINQMKWAEVNFITYNHYETKLMASKLKETNRLSLKMFKTIFLTDENVEKELKEIKDNEIRLNLVYLDKKDGERLFEIAKKLDMFTQGWLWVVSEQLIDIPNIPQGVFGVKLKNSAKRIDNNMRDSISIVYQSLIKYHQNYPSQNKIVSLSSCLASSPVWKNHSSILYKAMKNTKLSNALTGYLEFNENGDRISAEYELLNSYSEVFSSKTNLKQVGSFQLKNRPGVVDNSKSLTLDIEEIFWPGNYQRKTKINDCMDEKLRANCPNSLKIYREIVIPPSSFMKKKHLRIVTLESIPYIFKRLRTKRAGCNETSNPDKLGYEVECHTIHPITNDRVDYCCYGYCIDLLRRLSRNTDSTGHVETEFTYDLYLVNELGNEVNTRSINSNSSSSAGEVSYTGILGELVNARADLAIGPIPITSEWASKIDFTKPFKYLGITILMKKETSRSNLASFLQPFEDTLWLLVALSVHVVALILYLLDRFSPLGRANQGSRVRKGQESGKRDKPLTLNSAIWFSWGVLLNSGIGEGTPKSFSARVFGMIWAGFSMIIVASYTANLAAFLVLDRPKAAISGIDDPRLRNPQKDFPFATVEGSHVEDYFKKQIEFASMYRTMQMHNFVNPEQAIQAIQNGTLKGFLWDSSRLTYETANDCELTTTGEIFGRSVYGIAFSKNNPWLHDISQAVLSFHERGLMENFDMHWISGQSKACIQDENSPATLGMTNMSGVFIMMTLGILIGLLITFTEIIYNKHKSKKDLGVSIKDAVKESDEKKQPDNNEEFTCKHDQILDRSPSLYETRPSNQRSRRISSVPKVTIRTVE